MGTTERCHTVYTIYIEFRPLKIHFFSPIIIPAGYKICLINRFVDTKSDSDPPLNRRNTLALINDNFDPEWKLCISFFNYHLHLHLIQIIGMVL
jgi:hypothetical protein